jgi:predicted outer membrane protein
MRPLLLVVVLWASAAFAQAQDEDAGVASTDATWVLAWIHQTNRGQLALARLAAARRGSVKIQLMGETMLGQLDPLEAQVGALARSRDLPLPDLPLDAGIATVSGLEGADFDGAFLDETVNRAEQALHVLERTPMRGDPELAGVVEAARWTLTTMRDDARRGRGEYVPRYRGD